MQLNQNNILSEIEELLGSDFTKQTLIGPKETPLIQFNRIKTQDVIQLVSHFQYKLDGIVGCDAEDDLEIYYFLSNPEFINYSEIIFKTQIDKKLEQNSIIKIYSNAEFHEQSVSNRLGLKFHNPKLEFENISDSLCIPFRNYPISPKNNIHQIGIFNSKLVSKPYIKISTNPQSGKIEEIDLTTGWQYSQIQPKLESLTKIAMLSEKLNYLEPNTAIHLNLALILNLERINEINISNKVRHIRTVLAELERTRNLLIWFSNLAILLNKRNISNRIQKIISQIEERNETIFGHPLLHNTIEYGSVHELSPQNSKIYFDFWDKNAKKITNLIKNLVDSKDFKDKSQGIGKISKKDALKVGLKGPALRSSGYFADIRKSNPYLSYLSGNISQTWSIAGAINGDCYSRGVVRYYDLLSSMNIMKELLFGLSNYVLTVSKQENKIAHFDNNLYGLSKVEAPQGELAIFLRTDPKQKLETIHSIRIITPDSDNFAALKYLLKDQYPSDIPMIIHSLDLHFPLIDL